MSLSAWHEEPISKEHDRKFFDCGDPSMNEFLQRYARQSHESGAAKTFLAIDNADGKTILGFYSLAPGALAYADTPELVRRGLARHDVPGFRLARIATDIRWHRHKDGTEFFANGFMSALRNEEGVLIGYAKIMTDETARKQLQDSLTESNSALEQFAYVASHDLQEPLRTMGTYAQLLARKYGGKLDAEAHQFLAFIVSAAARMSSLVQDLLSYARLTTEEDRPSSIALDEDLEAAITHLDQAIQESDARITHDPLPTLPVDHGQMVRLFQNLIGNAVKYRKPGRPSEVHISAEQIGTEWVISIRDNGIGFDPEYASIIFAPFKRLHAAEAYPGTGVGLAICRRIVQAQGGRIWAESQPGEGTTFFFTLPVESHPQLGHTPPINMPRPT